MREDDYYELRELIRGYVDSALEAGGEPDSDDFVKTCGIRELTGREELHVINLIICETERWKRLGEEQTA